MSYQTHRRRPAAPSADPADLDEPDPPPPTIGPDSATYGGYEAIGAWRPKPRGLTVWTGRIKTRDSVAKYSSDAATECAHDQCAHDVLRQQRPVQANEINGLNPNIGHGVIAPYGRPYEGLTPDTIAVAGDADDDDDDDGDDVLGYVDDKLPPLLIGFDAEWTAAPVRPDRRRVLSYQFCIRDPAAGGSGWFVGVYFLPYGVRFSLGRLLGHFLLSADAAGVLPFPLPAFRQRRRGRKLGTGGRPPARDAEKPQFCIVLCGHYGIVDMTALYGGNKLLRRLDTLRRTEASVERPMALDLTDAARHGLRVTVHLRDSMLLSSAKSSLADLGKAMKLPKVDLPDGFSKDAMDMFLAGRPDAFLIYAAVDAVISMEWVGMVGSFANGCLPDRRPVPPPTIGSISASLIRSSIMQVRQFEDFADFDLGWRGLVVRKEKRKLPDGRLRSVKVLLPSPPLSISESAWQAAFFGGRNECLAHGPCRPSRSGIWWDHDVRNAYVVAMALVRDIDWSAAPLVLPAGPLRRGDVDPLDFLVADVSFEFPPLTRVPCLPIKDDDGRGLVFVQQGRTFATAPELFLALEMGATVHVHAGYVHPALPGGGSLRPAVRQMLRLREQAKEDHGKGSPQELLGKDTGNSGYGKLGQSLRDRRAYSTRYDCVDPVPPSPITSAPHAAMVTALVRALVSGAMVEQIDRGYRILSVTTDGFISNAPPAVFERLSAFGFADMFRTARSEITGREETIWECKHAAAQMVMGKTRVGFGLGRVDGYDLPSAKGGYARSDADNARIEAGEAEAEVMAEHFLYRDKDFKAVMKRLPSPREYIRADADGMMRNEARRVDWSYDFKRRPDPTSLTTGEIFGVPYVSFDTLPHNSISDFDAMRRDYDDLGRPIMRDVEAVRAFLDRARGREVAARAGVRRAGMEDGGMRRTAAVAILRGIRQGVIRLGVPLDGPAIRSALSEAFDVEVSPDDWKNAGRGRRPGSVLTEAMIPCLRAAAAELLVEDWVLWASPDVERAYRGPTRRAA